MAYATAEALAAELKVRVTAETQPRLERCLDAAAEEIDHALAGPVADPVPATVVAVNLERAVELWRGADVAFGVLGLEGGAGATGVARDGFARHAARLAPFRHSWGIA